MKKILFLLLIILAFTLSSEAQNSTYPSWVTQRPAFRLINDAVGEDTIVLNPTTWRAMYSLNITSNANLKPLNRSSNNNIFDEAVFIVKGNTGNVFRLIAGSGWSIGTTKIYTMTTGVALYLVFRYNGSSWDLITSTNPITN